MPQKPWRIDTNLKPSTKNRKLKTKRKHSKTPIENELPLYANNPEPKIQEDYLKQRRLRRETELNRSESKRILNSYLTFILLKYLKSNLRYSLKSARVHRQSEEANQR